MAATDDDVPEWGKDYGSKRRSSKKLNKKQDHIHDWARNPEYGNGDESGARVGGNGRPREGSTGNGRANGGATNGDPNWDHEF